MIASMADECIVVFARTPAPGRSKTRLIPALGPQGAADLYAAFLQDWLPRCIATAPTIVYAADPNLEGYLQDQPWCPKVEVREQCPGDLGAKMHDALTRTLQEHAKVLLVGSDLPLVGASSLRHALSALEDHPLAFGPCEDGGYWCVAAREVPMFQGIRWSCEHTLGDTLAQNTKAGLVARHEDIDTPEDLLRLRSVLQKQPDLAPVTAAALRELLL